MQQIWFNGIYFVFLSVSVSVFLSICLSIWILKPEEPVDDGEFGDLYAIPTQHSEPVKRAVNEAEQEEEEEEVAAGGGGGGGGGMPGVFDPKLLDSMDPETMRKVLMGEAK